MELQNVNIFPCRKFGMNKVGVIEPIDYELVGIKDTEIVRIGLPVQGPHWFDNYWTTEDSFDAIGILHSYTIDLIIDNWIRNGIDEREVCIQQLLNCCEWATDTFITEDARKHLEKLKKELNR